MRGRIEVGDNRGTTDLFKSLQDLKVQARILQRDAETRTRAKVAIGKQVGKLGPGDVVAQLSAALRQSRTRGFGETGDAMRAVLPTIVDTPTASGERISGDEWLDFYTTALRAVPSEEVVRSTPAFLEIGSVLAPAMLRGEDGQVDQGKLGRIRVAWVEMLETVPKADLTRALKDTVVRGFSRMSEAVPAELPEEKDPDPEPQLDESTLAPVVPLRAEDEEPNVATDALQPEDLSLVTLQPPGERRLTVVSPPAERTVFEEGHQSDTPLSLDLNADGEIKSADVSLSTLELRILYVLGTATNPLKRPGFYEGITGKPILPGPAKSEINKALVRLRVKLHRMVSPQSEITYDTFDKFIPPPSPDNPTYRLQGITVANFPDHPICTPEGYVTIPPKTSAKT